MATTSGTTPAETTPAAPPGSAAVVETIPPPDWLAERYPWDQRVAVVNGRRMAYLDAGPRDGRPVLLLHGNPNWSYLYRFVVPPLVAAGYRAIAPDWVGSGRSGRPRADAALTLAHHIADLVALIDVLELDGYVVVGQDWGGPQGTGAALQRRDRLAALVLMNTWLFTDVCGPFHASPLPWTTWHAPLAGPVFLKRYRMLSRFGMTAVSTRGPDEIDVRAYQHVYAEPDSEAVTLTWPRTIPLREGDRGWADMASIQRRLPELAGVPVGLIWAPDDPVFPLAYADRLRELLPHAQGPVLITGAKHFLQDDRGPEVAAALLEFLERTVGSRA